MGHPQLRAALGPHCLCVENFPDVLPTQARRGGSSAFIPHGAHARAATKRCPLPLSTNTGSKTPHSRARGTPASPAGRQPRGSAHLADGRGHLPAQPRLVAPLPQAALQHGLQDGVHRRHREPLGGAWREGTVSRDASRALPAPHAPTRSGMAAGPAALLGPGGAGPTGGERRAARNAPHPGSRGGDAEGSAAQRPPAAAARPSAPPAGPRLSPRPRRSGLGVPRGAPVDPRCLQGSSQPLRVFAAVALVRTYSPRGSPLPPCIPTSTTCPPCPHVSPQALHASIVPVYPHKHYVPPQPPRLPIRRPTAPTGGLEQTISVIFPNLNDLTSPRCTQIPTSLPGPTPMAAPSPSWVAVHGPSSSAIWDTETWQPVTPPSPSRGSPPMTAKRTRSKLCFLGSVYFQGEKKNNHI